MDTNRQPAARVRSAILAAPWAMTPEMVATILAIVDREGLSPEALAAQLGRPLEGSRAVELRGSVAVIPVAGPIVRYADSFTAISGATALATLATDLRAALDAPGVASILLLVDSPGGEVAGVAEFAEQVRAAAARKRVAAFVGGSGASAAYWIASAAGEIVAARTALVGSIGIVMAVPDPDKRQSRTLDFVSSQSPHKRPNPHTDEGRARLQATVDALGAIFVGDVARYRGMAPAAVQALGGDLLVGQRAVDAGLVDRLGSFEGVIADLQANPFPRQRPAVAATRPPVAHGHTGPTPADAPLSPARRRELLSHSPTGRAILAREDAARATAGRGGAG